MWLRLVLCLNFSGFLSAPNHKGIHTDRMAENVFECNKQAPPPQLCQSLFLCVYVFVCFCLFFIDNMNAFNWAEHHEHPLYPFHHCEQFGMCWHHIWAAACQNQQNYLCAQRRLRSPGHQPVWSESSFCTQWVAKDPSFLHEASKDWSDWTDIQADLSLRWAHMPFCWFFHEAAHFHCVISHFLSKDFG